MTPILHPTRPARTPRRAPHDTAPVAAAHIAGFGHALPHRITQQQFLAVDERQRERRGQSERVRQLMRQFAEHSGIRYRHTTQVCWLPEDERPQGVPDIFGAHDFDPPGWQRAREWQRVAPELAERAARAALAQWGGPLRDITHVITTCTSGWSEPGIACHLIDELGLPLDTAKQELNFNGCFCGMTCLRLARDLIRGGEARNVLVVAVETASVQYDCDVTELSHLVASALFADGAAAFVVGREGPWRFDAAGMALVPGTREMLRMSPDLDEARDTYRMHLDRRVGARLAQYFRDEHGAELLQRVLDRCGTHPALAVHPGGPAILEAVRAVFSDCGWSDDALGHSLDALYNTGNLGAAAMPYVLSQLLPTLHDGAAVHDDVALFAFGPGVTVEWGMLSRA